MTLCKKNTKKIIILHCIWKRNKTLHAHLKFQINKFENLIIKMSPWNVNGRPVVAVEGQCGKRMDRRKYSWRQRHKTLALKVEDSATPNTTTSALEFKKLIGSNNVERSRGEPSTKQRSGNEGIRIA